MAWKVFDAFPGSGEGRNLVYGPMPCKRWIPVAGERYKVRKRPAPPRAIGTKKEITARMAVDYARWLASRDGVALPDGAVTVVWSDVEMPGRKPESRVSCVTFGTNAGRARIDIPNWNWTPAEPVEETVSADIVFEDFRQRGWQILLQAA